MSKIKNLFFVGNKVEEIILKNVKFKSCPRETCYCNELISKPEKTKITPTLLMNASKCRKEYYYMLKISKKLI